MNQLALSFLLGLLITLQGCSNIISATTADPITDTPGKRSFGSYVDDELIELKASVNIDKADSKLAESHIVVVSYNGVILLTGQVSSESLRLLAAETVAKINQVKRVHNELKLAGSTSFVARSNDAWITSKLKSKFSLNSDIPSDRIKVVTENGVVYLMGIVSREEGRRASELTRSTGGVQKVVQIFEYM